MMKPLFNERVKESIIFQDDIASLHNFVDKDILPEELGGTLVKFDNSSSALAVSHMKEYFAQLKTYADYVNK